MKLQWLLIKAQFELQIADYLKSVISSNVEVSKIYF